MFRFHGGLKIADLYRRGCSNLDIQSCLRGGQLVTCRSPRSTLVFRLGAKLCFCASISISARRKRLAVETWKPPSSSRKVALVPVILPGRSKNSPTATIGSVSLDIVVHAGHPSIRLSFVQRLKSSDAMTRGSPVSQPGQLRGNHWHPLAGQLRRLRHHRARLANRISHCLPTVPVDILHQFFKLFHVSF